MRRKDKKQSGSLKSGRAIIEKKERKEEKSLDLEREKLRKRSRKRTVMSAILVFILIGVLTFLSVIMINNLIGVMNEHDEVVETLAFEPTVEILDENGTGQGVSARTREYVGQLEADLKDLGQKMTRAVLPMGKMREIDINLEGMSTYFKVSTNRETGVTAEDIVRMVKYLEENGLIGKVSYVDLRVEGKAFYK